MATEVLAALHHAHGLAADDGRPLEVVHRDISPRNVLLSLGGSVKLADFGIAAARSKVSVTVPGQVLGTICSMAPEQALGQTVDRRADLYSVGVLLYRMVTGAEPFCDQGGDVLDRVRDGVFMPPAELDPRLPERLAAIVLRAMAADPVHRHPTASHMRRDLLELAVSLGLRNDSEALVVLLRDRLPGLAGSVRSWLGAEGGPDVPIWDAATLILGREGRQGATRVEGRGAAEGGRTEPAFCLDRDGEEEYCEPIAAQPPSPYVSPDLPPDLLLELEPDPRRARPR